MTQVKANRVIRVTTENERPEAPLSTNSNNTTEGKSDGWSLIYCKGPEGEQLEFVQALGPVKLTFGVAFDARRRSRGEAGLSYKHTSSGAFSVVAEVRAKPGCEDELRAVTLPLIALVRSDPKNLVYFLQEDRFSPGHLVFHEVFANERDFEAHNMPYVKQSLARLPELADGGARVTRMQIIGPTCPLPIEEDPS